MISKEALNIDWITEISKKNQNVDKILVEKVIRALSLLEGLASSSLAFTFKGGTALMLLLGSTKRLSIDIDIVSHEGNDLEPIFQNFIENKWFTRFEEHKRKKHSEIKKAHYKFFYIPIHKTNQEEEYILLDILFEENKYLNLLHIEIDSPFLKQDAKPISVNIPSLEDILGDKLTAYAPNTTGIPYEKSGRSATMEIIKQLYDIGCLFDNVSDMQIISRTFQTFAETELGYRNIIKSYRVVLEDIFQTSLCIATRGGEGQGSFEALNSGISRIKAFIFSESYHIEKAIIHASKAAYLSKLIEKDIPDIEYFSNPLEVKDWIIEQPYPTKLNKLKKSNPEAFFYWFKTFELFE